MEINAADTEPWFSIVTAPKPVFLILLIPFIKIRWELALILDFDLIHMWKTNMNINTPNWETKLLAGSKTSLDWVVKLMLIGNCFLFAWLLNEPVCYITIGCRML